MALGRSRTFDAFCTQTSPIGHRGYIGRLLPPPQYTSSSCEQRGLTVLALHTIGLTRGVTVPHDRPEGAGGRCASTRMLKGRALLIPKGSQFFHCLCL